MSDSTNEQDYQTPLLDAGEVNKIFKNGVPGGYVGQSRPNCAIRDIEQVVEEFKEKVKSASQLPARKAVQPKSNFRGASYGEWIERWSNWLLSSHPYYDGGDTIFLRGNMGYYTDPNSFLDMTIFSGNRQEIMCGTAIFMPVITCNWNIGDIYEGKRIEDEDLARHAIRDYIYGGGPMWATIANLETDELFYIVDDLIEFYAESPRFKLDVSESSKLRSILDDPLEPGEYDAVMGGVFVILMLDEGRYRIRFGGKGRRQYYTDAIYDIDVVGDERATRKKIPIQDVSKFRHPYEPLLAKYLQTTNILTK